ncbi:efflux RND transporter periplasmic adaptor subunit [Acidobacteria bacterium AH-259-L09]|nr:efflux RND transporter periplasmic adaptor subunit [Acidobacteria bacterium AH-259-L09]
MRKKVYGFLILVALFAVAGYFIKQYVYPGSAVSGASSEVSPGNGNGDEEAVPVELVRARQGEISYFVSSTANLRPLREVSVVAQGEGIAKEVLVEEGDHVRKGQLLSRLDDTEPRIRLQSARQKLAQAKLQLETSRIRNEKAQVQVKNTGEELDRYQRLYKEKLVSEREVAQIKYKLDELEHDLRVSSSESRELVHKVEELEAEIEQSQLEISRTRIEAPYSGYITKRTVDLGQTVKNGDELFKLGDFSPLLTEVFLSEREASQVSPGQSVTVISGVDESQSIQGHVARVSPIVDQSTGTVKVTVELKNARGPFKPGAFVQVDIQSDTRRGSVLVPKRAVVEEDNRRFVFVVEKDKARRVPIELGYESNAEVEIRQGISPGEAVVVAGHGALKDGSMVKLTNKSSAN